MSLITLLLALIALAPSNIVVISEVLQGTICGLRTGTGTNCNGQNPMEGCPSGFFKQNWAIGKTGTGLMQFCAVSDDSTTRSGKTGTVCGLKTGPSGHLCGGVDPLHGCPAGYEGYAWRTSWGSRTTAWCSKIDASVVDLPGTVCGMQTNADHTGVSCAGRSPGRGSCPPGYSLMRWRVNFGDGFWSWCYKQ